jgi:nucleoside-diphosphate-sugar epimerase
MRDTVLLTGGAGFVGAHLTRKLLARGRRVRVLDSFVYGDSGLRDVIDHPDLELVSADVCDPATLSRAVRGVRKVIALAALVGDAACDLRPQACLATNYESTRLTLSACEEAGVERLVFASSCSVYGANGTELLDETSQLNPVSLYARTRVMSENLLRQEARRTEVVILRLATVCGVSPRMRFDLMVNTMTACAMVNRTIRVSGAKQWRPHLHVQDAAEAFALAAEAPQLNCGVFNVGTDEQNFTIGEVAEMVAARVPGTNIEYVPDHNDARSYRVRFDHIREGLGFRGERTVDDAIAEVAELLASGAIDDFGNKRFHNAKWLSSNGCGQATT